MSLRMASKVSGGTSSCKPESSLVIASGSTSTRLERNWPTFIITPPISIAKVRNLEALFRRKDRAIITGLMSAKTIEINGGMFMD